MLSSGSSARRTRGQKRPCTKPVNLKLNLLSTRRDALRKSTTSILELAFRLDLLVEAWVTLQEQEGQAQRGPRQYKKQKEGLLVQQGLWVQLGLPHLTLPINLRVSISKWIKQLTLGCKQNLWRQHPRSSKFNASTTEPGREAALVLATASRSSNNHQTRSWLHSLLSVAQLARVWLLVLTIIKIASTVTITQYRLAPKVHMHKDSHSTSHKSPLLTREGSELEVMEKTNGKANSQ